MIFIALYFHKGVKLKGNLGKYVRDLLTNNHARFTFLQHIKTGNVASPCLLPAVAIRTRRRRLPASSSSNVIFEINEMASVFGKLSPIDSGLPLSDVLVRS